MARVLVLREQGDARCTAALVVARGHEALSIPLQEVRPLEPTSPVGPFSGFLVTSGHAVEWLAGHHGGCRLPVLAVGSRTADRLARAGFAEVSAGAGSAEDLVPLAANLLDGERHPFLYAAGLLRLADLEAGLAAQGVPVVVVEVYEMVDRQVSAREVAQVLGADPPDAVLVLSRRQAELFTQLADAHPAFFPPEIDHLCLSSAIADHLPSIRRRHAKVAVGPRLSSLLDLLA